MTDLSTEAVNAALEGATDGPWKSCGDGKCACGMVWSRTAAHPVATAQKTPWGDTWHVAAPTPEDPDAVKMEFMEYGSFPKLEHGANARLIAMAPDLAAEVLLLRAVLGGIRDVLSNPSMICASDRLDEIETLLSDVPE